jgi:hypothetical protein
MHYSTARLLFRVSVELHGSAMMFPFCTEEGDSCEQTEQNERRGTTKSVVIFWKQRRQ